MAHFIRKAAPQTARRALAVMLSALLVFGMAPVELWAEGVEGVTPSAVEAVGTSRMQGNARGEGGTGSRESANDVLGTGAPSPQDGLSSNEEQGEGQPSSSADETGSSNPQGSSTVRTESGTASHGSEQLMTTDATSTASPDQIARDDEVVTATISVIGVDATGAEETWLTATAIEMPAGSTAADLSEKAFAYAGITADYDADGEYGWYLNTITSPNDPNHTLGYDATTQAYWQLFYNGESASVGAGSIELAAGDTVVWYYSVLGDEAPSEDGDVAVDPDAERPDWESPWPGSSTTGGLSSSVTSPTPTEGAEASWTVDYHKYSSSAYPNASEPVIAGDYIYLAVDSTLVMLDKATGAEVKTTHMASGISYTCRPVYARGLIVIPLGNGRVQAFSAKDLTCVWVTEPVGDLTQSSCTVAVDGDYLVVGTVDVLTDSDTWTTTYEHGTVTRINIETGAIAWRHTNATEGYYWSGAAVTEDFVIVCTSAGTLEVLDKQSGDVCSIAEVGGIVNSECFASSDGSRVYVFTNDGVLHLFSLSQDGVLADAESIDVGLDGSVCSPTVDGETVYIGGTSNGVSALAIIDLVAHAAQLVTEADDASLPAGGIKGAPLVSKQDDGTYVYFTVNYAKTTDYVNYTAGGGVYRYKLGDTAATLIWAAKGYEGFCDSPVICDAEGNLYYINDSGHLFALRAGTGASGDPGQGGSGGADGELGTGGSTGSTGGKTVAPGSRPLGSGASAAAEQAAASAAVAEDAADGQVSVRTGADARNEATAASPMNLWAVGGIAAGVAGLVIVGLYMALGKPRGEA